MAQNQQKNKNSDEEISKNDFTLLSRSLCELSHVLNSPPPPSGPTPTAGIIVFTLRSRSTTRGSELAENWVTHFLSLSCFPVCESAAVVNSSANTIPVCLQQQLLLSQVPWTHHDGWNAVCVTSSSFFVCVWVKPAVILQSVWDKQEHQLNRRGD